jgi:phage N-6-adenine-methyltransferase
VSVTTLTPANDNCLFAHRTQFSGDNEWYTPARYVELAREVMGSIDVDPASNDYAQRTVKAATFYTVETNGLDKPWVGKVWMNPPYGRKLIGRFIDKLMEEYQAGRTTEAIVLTNNSTDTKWATALFENAASLCFTRGRVKFISPTKKGAATLPMGQLFTYVGNRPHDFAALFGEVGHVVTPANDNRLAFKAA